jgi:quercetin dioxygenase-like cupin family protein
VTAVLALSLSFFTGHAATSSDTIHAIQIETLLKTGTAWDGSALGAYPEGKPEVAVLRITIPAHTTMDWHSHPMPNVAYVVSGELTVEKQDGTLERHFTAGQTVPELVNVAHRGVTGERAVELIVFYAAASGMPLSTRHAN